MRISESITDGAVLGELGSRLRETRLQRNLTQAWLAAEAGVSTPTLAKLESGRPVQLATLVRVLRALGMLNGLELAVPEPQTSPIEQLRRHRGRRRRASSGGAGTPPPRKPWRWGDER